MTFTFDPSKPSGNRIEESSIEIDGRPLDKTKVKNVYLLATLNNTTW